MATRESSNPLVFAGFRITCRSGAAVSAPFIVDYIRGY